MLILLYLLVVGGACLEDPQPKFSHQVRILRISSQIILLHSLPQIHSLPRVHLCSALVQVIPWFQWGPQWLLLQQACLVKVPPQVTLLLGNNRVPRISNSVFSGSQLKLLLWVLLLLLQLILLLRQIKVILLPFQVDYRFNSSRHNPKLIQHFLNLSLPISNNKLNRPIWRNLPLLSHNLKVWQVVWVSLADRQKLLL